MFDFGLNKRVQIIRKVFLGGIELPNNIYEYMLNADPIYHSFAMALSNTILTSAPMQSALYGKSKKRKIVACELGTLYIFRSIKKNMRPQLTDDQIFELERILTYC